LSVQKVCLSVKSVATVVIAALVATVVLVVIAATVVIVVSVLHVLSNRRMSRALKTIKRNNSSSDSHEEARRRKLEDARHSCIQRRIAARFVVGGLADNSASR
jgi:F0F1-type ATP synthase membrane subunit b/b'